MPTKYLQLRVHSLECHKMTENRQNFLGISLETDPDAIDISAIVTDAAHGLVAQAPPVYLGNRYTAGKKESWPTPKVIAEVPIAETDPFPRRVSVMVNMAEKDDGAGFDELLERVAQELAQTLGDEVGDELGSDISDSEYYRMVEDAAGDIIGGLFKEITKLLGLGDDPFRPVSLEHEMRNASDAPSGTHTVSIVEPNSAHHGRFTLTYGWHLSDRSAMSGAATSTSSGGTRSTSAALTAGGYAATPYPRPFRSFRFARPMRAKTAVKATIIRPSRAASDKPAKPPKVTTRARSMWWYPSVLKPLGSAAAKK